MELSNISIIGGMHTFGSMATLLFIPLGHYAASRQPRAFWAYTHPLLMTLS